jgi:formate hydrogenlyase transcriptional activator
MASKAQLQPNGLAAYQTQVIFKLPRASVTRAEQCQTTAASLKVLRNMDAGWLFESAPDAMLLVDGQGWIAIVNTQLERMFGYRREELVGEPVEKLLPKSFRNGDTAYLSGCTAAPRTRPMHENLQLHGLRKDGTEFPIEMSLSPLETEEGVLISSAIRDVSDLKRVQELQAQLEFEQMMLGLSKTFINLPVERIDGEVQEGLRELAEVMDLDRVNIYLFDADKISRTITHAWIRPGIPPPPPGKIMNEEFPWIASRIANREISFISGPEELPEEAAAEREYMLSVGVKSWLAIPLQVGGELLGSVGASTFRRRRTWDSLLISRFQQAAEIFANALARARADEVLHQAYREIEQLKGQLEEENVYLREEVKLEHHHHEVIGDSEGIRRVLKKAEQVAPTDSTVLLLGETGTGKELIARAIHELSRRKDRAMVKVNCAALPASLVESELFGREKGAYTGALTREIGRFELANGSTILLDEIGELPLELQSKLLRVLQEGEFERLGGPKTIKVDVRVIAATSRNLQQAAREGKFREDLFYRLNVFPLTIPPLRERREDIPALAWHFVNDLSQRMGRSIESIHGSTMEAFKSYYWPGNVRELRNVIERFLITSTNTVFRADLSAAETAVGAHAQTFEEVERNHILHIMGIVGWRVRGERGAAQILGLKPTTLESRMQKLEIVRPK